MKQFNYPALIILLLLASEACKKSSVLNPQNSFVKFFPSDSNYQAGGCFQLADGNYVVYGFDPDGFGNPPLIIKCDQSGNTIWQKKLSSGFHFLKVKALEAGGMLAVGIGSIDSSINICKLGGAGDSIEIFIAHRPEIKALATVNYLPDFVIESNGDITILSNTRPTKYKVPFIMRVDPQGGFILDSVYNSIAPKIDFRTAGIVRWKHGYYINGSAEDRKDKQYRGIFCAKLDSAYNLVWDSLTYETNTAINVSGIAGSYGDSGAVICGEHDGNENNGTLYTMQIDGPDTLGQLVPYYNYPNQAMLSSIMKANGGYIIAATVNQLPDQPQILSYSKLTLLKINSALEQEWINEFNSERPITGSWAAPTSDGGYLVCGYEHTASYVYTMVLIKTDAFGNIVEK